MKQRIAVIGGGISGIMAAHRLQSDYLVTLFERQDYLGGHTHTITVPSGPDEGLHVDTGFIVFNDWNYPVIMDFFAELGITGKPTVMSFSYNSQKQQLFYSTRGLRGLFAQRSNIVRPRYWRFLAGVLTHGPILSRALREGDLSGKSLRQFFLESKLPMEVFEWLVIPMAAAIWSASFEEIWQFPAETFARFYHNHGLLSLWHHPQWYFVEGGSHTYVRNFRERFQGEVRCSAPVTRVDRSEEGVVIHCNGGTEAFDKVVIAVHADEVLGLLAAPTPSEQQLFAPWSYSQNITYLHSDERFMPSHKSTWAAWNYVERNDLKRQSPVAVTYHMNALQNLKAVQQWLVTLNPHEPPRSEHVVARIVYRHPVFSYASLETQARLPSLNGILSTWYCGAYFKNGFHEDGAVSGKNAANHILTTSR
ncbi:FAD-dependent oxidoreductase, partial [Myxococcota bacterium]|nr:FAD-dependent oxidoreductase [Myxococcota bacterium]MBU1537264.1 FAD-dependent oxidoreductase [Myxococcota bacterium]